ncbi:histidinol-phosphate aminotransferase [Fulvitalea axinellae]|uniref:Histidinol-phosphate aminotransferase n=1 Tax=Fulvitalea axinellae TaxID=1182444 RepID=A0AAU9D1S1_9BACT|nr:histidinol-phosphate aminotransferase [Fulvitalea axinellae]
MFDINQLIRPHLRDLKPYSSARDEFSGDAKIFLDANENPLGSAGDTTLNRYPDPYQRKVKEKVSELTDVPAKNIFLGNGSDEPIDLLVRAFCRPAQDSILIMPPTYGMYEVSAGIHDTGIVRVPLRPDFTPDVEAVKVATTPETKLLFICTPNNPTGNDFGTAEVERLVREFPGIAVVDEAYVDFCGRESWTSRLSEFPNLVVLRTFSKAWGMAGLRLGMAFASEEIIEILNKIKPPYNINELAQIEALKALENGEKMKAMVAEIIEERSFLEEEFGKLSLVEHVFPSDSNFILAKVDKADAVYDYLVNAGIVVRNRSRVRLCEGSLRVTVGTREENLALIGALKNI